MEKIRQNLFFFLCLGLILGLFLIDTARVVPSLAMIGIVLLGLSYWIKKGPYSQKKNVKPYWALAGTFLILLPSWFYSDNKTYLLERWQIALPFLVLPLAFMMIPQLPKRRYFQLYQFYFCLILITALSAFVYYLMHQQFVNQLYLESKVMPALMSHHPTLSVMLAFATFVGYKLYQSGYYTHYKWERFLLLFGGIFLFIFTHIFSVRSGLLALYILIFVELALIAIQQKKVKVALLTAAFLFTVGAVTLWLSPTVSNKFANTSQDIRSYQNNESANNHSLGSRIISYQNGYKIAKESSLLFGCGLGDVNDLSLAIFKKDYPDISRPIIPHNQFLFYLAAIGIIGTIAFIILFYFPLFFNKNYKNSFLLAQYLVLFISYQFEAPIETQLGVAFSLIFILIPVHQDLHI